MQNYKTFIGVAVLGFMLIPQIALAAWWNPFSWNFFSKKEANTEVLENRIKDLEKRLNTKPSVGSIMSDISTSTPTTTPEIKKENNVVSKSKSVKVEAKATVNAVSRPVVQPSTSGGQTVNVPAVNVQAPAAKTAEEIRRAAELELAKANDERIRQEDLKQQRLVEQQRLDAKFEEKRSLDAAHALLSEKQGRLDAINLKIAKLNAKYAADTKTCGNGSGSVSSRDACMDAMTDTYDNEYNSLMAEFQQIKYGN